MKFFPEFAVMVQKWSGQNTFQSLHGWARIAYAVRAQRYMKLMGANISFTDTIAHLTDDNEKDTTSPNKKSGQKMDNQQVREMNYEQFHCQYGDTFNTFNHLIKPKKQRRQSSSKKAGKFFGDQDSGQFQMAIK